MDEQNIRKYAAYLGVTNFRPRTGSGWMETKCPLAPWTHEKGYDKSPSFAIRCDPMGPSHYACQACHHKGSMSGLFFKMYGFTKNQQFQDLGREVEQLEIAGFAQNLPDWDEAEHKDQEIKRTLLDKGVEYQKYPLAIFHKEPLDYMLSRGIRFSTVMRMGLRYHYREDRVMFPVIDRNNELRGFSGRAMYDKAPMKAKDFSGLNKVELFLNEHRVWQLQRKGKIKFVICVEGLIDVAAVIQAGYENVLGFLGAEMTKAKLEKLISLNLPIIWMMDNDEGGYGFLHGRKIDRESEERDIFKSALRMMEPHVPQLIVSYPKNKNDPGSCNEYQIRKMVKDAKLYFSN